ncbi:hypothetical protein EOM09_00275 [bacterium]|nr:hypothetical protein [bacterium]
MANKTETMHSPKMTTPKPSASTQRFLDISEIRDDLVIMKDGSLKSVIMVSSINFALKSVEEQEAIISSYVRFLNSLNAPIQIVIQSRRLDLDSYIEELENNAKKQKNELLKMQINEYIKYIKDLVVLGNIMTKKFFVVVSYDPSGKSNNSKTFMQSLTEIFSPSAAITISRKSFEKYKIGLSKKVSYIKSNLNNLGLLTTTLDTKGLIELFYSTYNMTVSKYQKIYDIEEMRLDEE